ncbi:MAG TPA: hypothetical protein VMH80_01775 [Bryobacteraceae bacterium]|nr:hypothetical protein [Bryobacteraceae bacterium]
MFRNLVLSAGLCASMTAFVVPVQAASGSNDAAVQRKADRVFQAVQYDARQALDHAYNLESFKTPNTPSWSMVALQLNQLRAEVNDMTRRLQHLQRISPHAAPLQQAAIDRMSRSVHLLSNYTADAIAFADSHHHDLWNLTYQRYLRDVGHDARILTRTADHAVERAKLNQEERPSGGNVRASS